MWLISALIPHYGHIINKRFTTAVVAEDFPSFGAPRPTNGTPDSPDLRSPVGRVPPYQPPAAAPGIGGSIQAPAFWPQSVYTRVENWRKYLVRSSICHSRYPNHSRRTLGSIVRTPNPTWCWRSFSLPEKVRCALSPKQIKLQFLHLPLPAYAAKIVSQ